MLQDSAELFNIKVFKYDARAFNLLLTEQTAVRRARQDVDTYYVNI